MCSASRSGSSSGLIPQHGQPSLGTRHAIHAGSATLAVNVYCCSRNVLLSSLYFLQKYCVRSGSTLSNDQQPRDAVLFFGVGVNKFFREVFPLLVASVVSSSVFSVCSLCSWRNSSWTILLHKTISCLLVRRTSSLPGLFWSQTTALFAVLLLLQWHSTDAARILFDTAGQNTSLCWPISYSDFAHLRFASGLSFGRILKRWCSICLLDS